MRTSHGIAALALAGLAVGAAVRADGAGRVSDMSRPRRARRWARTSSS